MILDSNLIIYASKPGYDELRNWMTQHPICVSELSRLEVLGYHRLIETDRQFFITFFSSLPVLPITSEVIDQAITLRQQRKMTLGDATIAATGLVNNLPIATHNISDFQWISGLVVIDPIHPT